MAPKFLEYLVVLCFERRYPKSNTVACVTSKYLAPSKTLDWVGRTPLNAQSQLPVLNNISIRKVQEMRQMILKVLEPHKFSGVLTKRIASRVCSADDAVGQGLQTVLSEGHISCYTTVREPDILRNVIVLGHATFCQTNQLFVNRLFFHY